jgi:hypothetical protein
MFLPVSSICGLIVACILLSHGLDPNIRNLSHCLFCFGIKG